MSHDNVTSRGADIECYRCPDHNTPSAAGGNSASEGRYIQRTLNFDGPRNSGIRTHTPAIEDASITYYYADTRVIMQFGNYYWGKSGCGRFESDNSTPSSTANANSIYKSVIKTSMCSGQGECDSGLRPLSKSKTTYYLDADTQRCLQSNESTQDCGENIGCASPSTFSRSYEFESPESAATQWAAFEGLDDTYKDYDFDQLEGSPSDLGLISPDGFSRFWRQNKSFIDSSGNPFGDLRGAKPKAAFR